MARLRDLVYAAAPLAVIAAAGAIPQAVANKISANAGGGQFQTVGGFIRAIFKDRANEESAFMLFTALVALMFLGGVVTVGLGALQAVRGDRGGTDTMIGGAYGLVAVLVMFAVIL
ncbi:MAG TPA: hypothetical protein VG474_11315 [Solirubrobacteraceae bacterium]|nr:hypothetical protein [Solirubrobacteraceae bacterium]